MLVMLKGLIVLGAVVLIFVAAVLVFYPSSSSNNQPFEPIVTPDETPSHITTTPSPSVCRDGETRDAICPDGVTTYLNENCVDGVWHQVMYVRNPCEISPATTTTLEKEIYHDVLRGGTYNVGDNVELFGEKGTIATGSVVDGIPVGYTVLDDKFGNEVLAYDPVETSEYGHLELISKPQKGTVVMNQNGKDIALMKYRKNYDFSGYLQVACEPERIPESTELVLLERYGNC